MSSITQMVMDKYVSGIPVVPSATSSKNLKRQARPRLTNEELEAKENIRECLKDGIWKVEFIKVSDGSTAVMECTLDQKYLPSGSTTVNAAEPKTGAAAAAEDLIHVYATDRFGWRAFVVTNVVSLEQIHD